ncbi:pyruvate dehydrogenase complex dihydrolipoamide acetyltransferase [Brevirhabdus pacifica]|uniref:Acetyltransferase component of pyruvate dehydrogenase complex n=1 Tax=Brevirhabdus pacifica TaxID=1267768 RepID=A0A1U7DEG1_9RHOB|nr:pyruvate dehydrogenase complex dihydrolipoamide acetyltransferase [Brevirhabdus pacifica]APX88387.1 pyruvate dehydrogenase complex dihydrolipoamide acetyltransferase [Brevirhabdus pacifica]OWU79702.1 branched-chain alpha-keto acid dehydrogenase subunit E2 [Loktanella sp. 22II-4b]PJJ87158.1 pyruvate dehydrogenase E2 component (dihydrolipoamide acetyltransferase) [Brevirhabdus pacifica]
MPTEILMPALSPTMEEGTLAKWLVKEGDTVNSGDLLAEIETDKATMEFEAVDEGRIGKLLIAEGTEGVAVNTPIAILLEEGESADDIDTAPQKGGDEKAKKADDRAAPSENAARSDAGSAPANEQPKSGTAAQGSAQSSTSTKSEKGDRVFASPLARRIAADRGLDLAAIQGSGPRGRIVKADVENAEPAASQAKPAASGAAKGVAMPTGASAEAVAAMFKDREYEEVRLDGMRKTIAARLTEAKQTIPHFYLRREVRIDRLMDLRAQMNEQLSERGIKLSVNDFVIKACANALQQVPDTNAVWAGDRILQLKPSDIAVAVAIDGGLITPVLRDAQQKSLSALSTEMRDLATRARDRKLAPHEYQGGSFSISNLGMFGVENFDAVINPPHGAILAVGAGVRKPVVGADGELTVATVMSMTLSVDHRVIDGARGAVLLKAIAENLEAPIAMLA